MMQNKKIIGLTGSTGSGKGTIGRWLFEKGFCVIDTDTIARAVVEKGEPCLNELVEAFSTDILTEEGTLNRKKMAHLVFNNADALALLNRITHKYITQEVIRYIQSATCEKIAIDAPVLHEVPELVAICDKIWVISASVDLRKKRIMSRDALTEQEAEMRMKAQSVNYEQFSDIVIENNGVIDELKQKIEDLLKDF